MLSGFWTSNSNLKCHTGRRFRGSRKMFCRKFKFVIKNERDWANKCFYMTNCCTPTFTFAFQLPSSFNNILKHFLLYYRNKLYTRNSMIDNFSVQGWTIQTNKQTYTSLRPYKFKFGLKFSILYSSIESREEKGWRRNHGLNMNSKIDIFKVKKAKNSVIRCFCGSF